jgi:hypothetical protein
LDGERNVGRQLDERDRVSASHVSHHGPEVPQMVQERPVGIADMVSELIPGRRQLWHRASDDQQSRADSQDRLSIADASCDLIQSIHMIQKSLLLSRHSHLPFVMSLKKGPGINP